MPKKSHPHKKALSHRASKKSGVHVVFTRITLILGVGLLFFFATNSVFNRTNAQITCANSKTCTTDLSQRIDNNVMGLFEGKQIMPPQIDTTNLAAIDVLGTTAKPGVKHIFVDLSSQTLYAFQGAEQVMKVFISSGKWDRTPVGNFHIWEKLVATRMAGGEGADAYDLPNVPWVMYFYHDFGLHGAYWHDNFGHRMSHGCVNMRQVDAKALYDWADGPDGSKLGTEVSVCSQFTNGQCIQNDPVQ